MIVKVNGGLGNQMFQYASGRALSQGTGEPLQLEVSAFDRMAAEDTPRRYELDLFNINASTVKPWHIAMFAKSSRVNRALNRLWEKRFKVVREKKDFVFDEPLSAADLQNSLLIGYWQSYRYFARIRSLLQKEFQPKGKPNSKNSELIEFLKNNDTVSIHVRRGDYISNPNAAQFHGSCDLGYYRRGIEKLQAETHFKHTFVFSDDPAWCQENLDLPWKTTFIKHNSGSEAYWDIYLMSLCKAHIIANSSFSWWGAWLAGEQSKMVIAPKRWTLAIDSDYSDLLPAEWIKI